MRSWEPILSEECDSDIPRLFPDLSSIDNYYLDMLEDGIPRNGTFSPSASQISSDYQSSTIIGYKDFTRIYTYFDVNGIERTVELILRIHETVSAGASREFIVSSKDAPFIALDSLGGNPNVEGSWNKLPDGIFDPAVDPSGVYTYVVPGGACTDTAYLTIYVEKNGGELGNKIYSSYKGLNSIDENFVYTRIPRVPIQSSSEIAYENEVIEQITYFDGLGRSKQSISIRAGGDLEDLVTPIEYDVYGRQVKEYLPYAASSQQGQIFQNPMTDAGNFYNAEKYEYTLNPYSEKNLEASPMSRIKQQGAPGAAWAIGGGHEIEFAYETNNTDEVRMLSVSFTNGDFRVPTLGDNGYYPAGSLYKMVTKDEQHDGTATKNHTTEEFKDKQGRLVLKRTYANTNIQAQEPHDTYYVYDDYGNLTYVLPPKMNAKDATLVDLNTTMAALGYQYEYDSRNRLVEKQLPGKGREYIVYNQLDQPVLTQDALQRDSASWLYTKYDALGRITSTGIYTDSISDQETMQVAVQNYYDSTGEKVYEEKSGTVYTNRSFPTTNLSALTENFYDNYNFDMAGITIPGSNIYSKPIEGVKTQGLTTGSRVKVLGTSVWITTINGYDDKGRLIWNTVKNDFLETTEVVESELDFVGNTLRQTTTHQKTSVAVDIITEDSYTYDNMNRLLTHHQSINSGPEELIAYNTYDELGQLVIKGIGAGTESIESDNDFVETTYTDLINATINADGSIAKTGSGEEDGFVETVQEFLQDGYVEFTPSGSDRLFMVGLTYEDPDYLDSDFTYYAYVVRDYIRTYEGGSEGWHSPATQTPVAPGDVITVERIGPKVFYKKNGEVFYESTFLSAGKLKGKVLLSAAGTNGTSVGYMELHKLDRKTKYLQEVNYTYNIRGWLKQINDPDNLGEDLFGFKMGYNNPETPGATALYNGNISETQWKTQSENISGNPVSNYYGYSYDALNRITGATDNTGNYNLSGIAYDKMGNILSLQRQGHISADASLFGTMDDLDYSYNGNQLVQVEDHSGNEEGFKDGNTGIDFAYDVNGNLTSDLNKGITAITYNHLNLPELITIGGQIIDYTYDATGVKLRKEIPGKTTEYAGNFIYEGGTLQFFSTPEGYVSYDGGQFNYVYNYLDHLGNVRLSYTDGDHNGSIDPATEIIQEKNYYPFGLTHQGYNGGGGGSAYGNAAAKRYGFGGKELQDENISGSILDWYDVSARNYDPALGRWMNIDPLAEQMRRHSPYNYAFDNPIYWFDPDGLSPLDHYFTSSGAYLGSDEAATDFVQIISEENWDKNKKINNNGEATISHEKGAELSENITEVEISNDAVVDIFNHFNDQLDSGSKMEGVNIEARPIGDEAGYKPSMRSETGGGFELLGERFLADNNIVINTSGGKVSSLYNTASNIKNDLVHEHQHQKDGSKSFGINNRSIKERRAIRVQRAHTSYKNTTEAFQKNLKRYERMFNN
ncbi:DUF6443 domain-containing protein [Salegentibacter sp. JZCK2]|uniref:DUF6443 domain-containing protein n=1 Tax=Salegentibacter tibetensis TaxID=2873600 RepID=UPI001CCFE864|nr:DUF6443 domain-containing protein [Salegentibacter tibetensis]MBZ9731572.1 DUF6443 domain-containing protein [Salegentibacter tibetensis]